ncbi:hypothetical protein [Alteribacter populi]|uniref:hypothetical protein n=1 Tax=Alteribacter populi TaxID=2011011 RepID=UPI000BBA8972|nr:hypothetical protein [Alteribacter populi]
MKEGNGKIEAVLGLIEQEVYAVKNGKPLKGSIGTEDGHLWYNVKGISVQARMLMYTYYHGLDAINGKMIKLIDDSNPRNLTAGNLIAVERKLLTRRAITNKANGNQRSTPKKSYKHAVYWN